MTDGGGRGAVALRRALAGASLLLLALAILHQASDARGRAAVERFFSAFGLDRRRPELLGTARVEGTADLAMSVAVRAATLDVVGRTPLATLEPGLRELWLGSVRALPEEVPAARAFALDAIARRPAWAFHALALAELVVSDEWREPPERRDPALWRVPLERASAWAPAAEGIRATWAAAALDRWSVLPEADRTGAREVLRRALADEGFQRIALPAVLATFGTSDGLSLLPPTPTAYATARRALPRTAPFEERAEVERRWAAAEREERRRRAAEIERLLAEGRGERASQLARTFLGEHPVALFDDAEGLALARVVLRAVADGRSGPWETDPRAGLVRYFLSNPRREAPGADLLRAAEGLTSVPDGTRALLRLLAGDDGGWNRIVSESDTLGSSEWTPFFVALARRSLRQGSPGEAERALARISRFDLGACDVLLVRRAVARALGNAAEAAEVAAAWPAAFPSVVGAPARSASGAGTLGLCVDPERDESSTLAVTLSAPEPVLAWWGWDGGRGGTLRLEAGETRTLELPLAGLYGRRTLSVGPLLGNGVTVTAARVAAAGESGPRPRG